MREKKSSAELVAEASSEDTRGFIRRVKRATRRKYTPEEKVRIFLAGFRGEIGISALCCREGIHPTVYCAWLQDFMEAGKGLLFSDRGDVELRGFEDPVRLYEVRWPEDVDPAR